MVKKVSQFMEELADREAIRECLYRYCRGIDRMDREMLLSAYWPDAVDMHGVFDAHTAEDFADNVLPRLAEMKQTSLNSTNAMIEIVGNLAHVESITRGLRCQTRPDGTVYDQIESGRYVDIMEKRDDEWRIIKRHVVRDFYREYQDSQNWETSEFYDKDRALKFGMRKPDDLTYDLFAGKL